MYGGAPGVAYVRVGTLDEPEKVGGPGVHLWVKEKQKWVVLGDGVRVVMDGSYERREVWGKEEFGRWERVMGLEKERTG